MPAPKRPFVAVAHALADLVRDAAGRIFTRTRDARLYERDASGATVRVERDPSAYGGYRRYPKRVRREQTRQARAAIRQAIRAAKRENGGRRVDVGGLS